MVYQTLLLKKTMKYSYHRGFWDTLLGIQLDGLEKEEIAVVQAR